MKENRTSVFSNGLIWFGAGVSLAEILTAAVAFASIPRLLAQTIMGLVIYAIIANVLAKSKVLSLQGVVA